MARYSRKLLGTVSLLLLLTGGGYALTKLSGSFQRDDSQLGTVKRANLIQRVTVSGVVLPNRRTTITPPYNAYVKKIYVRIGDTVKAGDPIVSLVQSLRDLNENSFPLRAPFPGTVVQIPRSEGEYVEAMKDFNSLVRIDDLSRLFILTEIPEGEIRKIKMGQEVLIKANGVVTRQYKGKITEISRAAKEKDKWGRSGDKIDFDVRLEIIDADEQVEPGMSAIVDIITNRADNILILNHEYIEKQGEEYFVSTSSNPKQKITVGLQNEVAFEVTSGVREGERVKMVDFFKGSESAKN